MPKTDKTFLTDDDIKTKWSMDTRKINFTNRSEAIPSGTAPMAQPTKKIDVER